MIFGYRIANRFFVLLVLLVLMATSLSAFASESFKTDGGTEKRLAPLVAGQGRAYTLKSLYSVHEVIYVQYKDLPGNSTDWITIVPVGTPDNEYKEWFYTQGQPAGSMMFQGLTAGTYEVRVYYDWNGTQSYQVKARSIFRVGAGVSSLKTLQEVYAPHQAIMVEFSGFPGNKSDWITIVPVGTPDNEYKEWFYTDGRPAGQMTFKGLPRGDYEIRGYFNWYGTQLYHVETRASFTVR